jgi:hypothetical protein
MDSIYSALATLPRLKSIRLSNNRQQARGTMVHPEILTKLLRVPSLRSVEFNFFYFTPALWQATVGAFMGGTAVTKHKFSNCSLSAEACATIMASGLGRNTSVSYIQAINPMDQALDNVLAPVLLSYSTLRDLSLPYTWGSAAVSLSEVFLALGKNTGLKSLKVYGAQVP